MAKHISTVTPPPTTTLYSFEFTEDELKAIVNVVGKTSPRDINNGLWEGSEWRSKVNSSEWNALYMVLLKPLGRDF